MQSDIHMTETEAETKGMETQSGEEPDEPEEEEEPQNEQDDEKSNFTKKQYIATLNMMLNECKEEAPFQLSPELFNQFTENMDFNHHDSSDEDLGFANQGQQGPTSDFFLAGESSNPLDPSNYLMVNRKSQNGKIRKIIMCRSTAQNIVAKAHDTLTQFKIVNDKWRDDNKNELKRVVADVEQARARMHKGSEFRVLSRQYIRDKIKPNWNQWCATFATNDGGMFLYVSFVFYTCMIPHI